MKTKCDDCGGHVKDVGALRRSTVAGAFPGMLCFECREKAKRQYSKK